MDRIRYTWLVCISAALWMAAVLPGCGGSGGGGGDVVPEEVADLTPPAISSSEPSDGATNVSVNTSSVKVDFTEDIIFSRSMLTVTGEEDSSKDSISNEDRSITVYLSDRPLSENKTYTLSFKGLLDKSGNIMDDTSISFTTGLADTTPPFIELCQPEDGAADVDVNILQIFVEFSELVVIEASMVEISPSVPGLTDECFQGDPYWSNRIAIIFPENTTLEPNKTYVVTFTGVEDLSGNPLHEPAAISFTTGD